MFFKLIRHFVLISIISYWRLGKIASIAGITCSFAVRFCPAWLPSLAGPRRASYARVFSNRSFGRSLYRRAGRYTACSHCACACERWDCTLGGRPSSRYGTWMASRLYASICGSCSCPSDGSLSRRFHTWTDGIPRVCAYECSVLRIGWTPSRTLCTCAAFPSCEWSYVCTEYSPGEIPCRKSYTWMDAPPYGLACDVLSCSGH